jgi:flagellar biosynthesis regulator FlaF
MSYAAYAGIQKATESPRDLEIRTISHITHQLAEANVPDVDPMTRVRALNGNIRLWTLLVEYLSDPANALPAPIKASYISLGLFARRASLAALSTTTDLSTLIRINTDVLDALDYQRQASIAA